jgi:hypothetical protein
MVKHSRRRRHSHGVKRGGSYSSASTYGSYVNGSGNSQFTRVFDQSGEYSGRASNIIVGAQGQNAVQPGGPSAQQLSRVQTAGRRHRKRGGFLGQVINQAIVPFSLLGLQQTYRRKKNGGRKTRKYRRHH